MSVREALGEIDGLVLAFIGLTMILALSAYLDMSLGWRVALGVPVIVLMVMVGYWRMRRKTA
jgi:hypothetical protein